MSSGYTVSADAAAALLRDLPPPVRAAFLAEVGVEETTLSSIDARVPQEAYNRLWELVAELAGDPELGLHVGENLDLDSFHVVGHLAARSDTFGQALERLTQYSRLMHDAGRIELEVHGDEVAIYPGCRGLPHAVPRHVAEMSAAAVLILGRELTGQKFDVIALELRHPRPDSIQEHFRIFGLEPTFDAPENMIRLEAKVLNYALRKPKEGFVAYLEAYAKEALAKLPAEEEDFPSKIQRMIVSDLTGGDVSPERIAKRLNMHERTLQRKLEAEGTAFQSLFDDARRGLAERHLREQRLSVQEIAFLLGYSDASNFHRAFRRWTGMTPARFREGARAN